MCDVLIGDIFVAEVNYFLFSFIKAVFIEFQSVNTRFVQRRYTTRPGAPAIVSCKHDKKQLSYLFCYTHPSNCYFYSFFIMQVN